MEFQDKIARLRPAVSQALTALALVALPGWSDVLAGTSASETGPASEAGPGTDTGPETDTGIVEITDLPPRESKADEKPAEAAPRLELPPTTSKVAQAFVLRRDQLRVSPNSPAKQPNWFDPTGEAPADSTSRTIDSEVKPAHRVEPAAPNASRAMALLVVARQMAVESRTAGDFSDVIDQCHRALDANPDRKTADALARLGAWAYNRRGEQLVRSNERAAFDDFQEAILLDPTCWEAFHNRGVTLARYNKLELAIADFDQVVKLEPKFALARFNRAETHSQLNRWEEAIVDYTAAIKEMPEEAMSYAGRAHAHHQSGDLREAMIDYNRALTLDGGCEKALVGRAMVRADQQLFAEAADDFRQALKVGNPSATTYHAVSWFLATCPDKGFRDPTKAIEAARRALSMSPENDPHSFDVLAAAYASAGEFEQAVVHQEQAIAHANKPEKELYQARLESYQKGGTPTIPQR